MCVFVCVCDISAPKRGHVTCRYGTKRVRGGGSLTEHMKCSELWVPRHGPSGIFCLDSACVVPLLLLLLLFFNHRISDTMLQIDVATSQQFILSIAITITMPKVPVQVILLRGQAVKIDGRCRKD